MKFLFTTFLLFFCSTFVYAQTIEIEPVAEHSSNSPEMFPAGDGTITVTENRFVLGSAEVVNPEAWSLSSSSGKAAFLQKNSEMNLLSYNSSGELLLEKELEFFSPSDNTINVYQFDDGRVVLRDNVANFSFLNARGDLVYSISNSSGSPDGERESQLVSDPSGNTIVLYNPAIMYGSQTGSRARVVYGDQDDTVFFSSRNEEIKNVRVSDEGAFITVLSAGRQGNRVTVFDRFGNELFQLTTDEDLIGATLHENAGHLTIYSGSRVQVYEIPGGGRIGSASSRSSIIYADYDPETRTIIALGGTQDQLDIDEPEITAVSISQREIARQEVPFPVSVIDADRLDIAATGTQSYEVSGLNRHLRINIRF